MSANSASAKDGPVIIVGGGLAGLVAAHELAKAKQKVIIVDQEGEQNLGGQAFWSLGGLFLIDTSEQRTMGIKDSMELAKADWFNSAQFDRADDEDFWAIQWANSYLDFAKNGMRPYLKALGIKLVTVVGWAERGGADSGGHGNSVPRFHVTWGTGPEVVKIFREPVLKAAKKGLVEFRFRHQVDSLIKDDSGRVIGVKGTELESTNVERGQDSSRTAVGEFELYGKEVIITSGGIGGNTDMVKKMWPAERFGSKAPETFVIGVPQHVDGRMLDIVEGQGARLVNKDRMWHYTGR
jgi:uncharacterized protein